MVLIYMLISKAGRWSELKYIRFTETGLRVVSVMLPKDYAVAPAAVYTYSPESPRTLQGRRFRIERSYMQMLGVQAIGLGWSDGGFHSC